MRHGACVLQHYPALCSVPHLLLQRRQLGPVSSREGQRGVRHVGRLQGAALPLQVQRRAAGPAGAGGGRGRQGTRLRGSAAAAGAAVGGRGEGRIALTLLFLLGVSF